jgi:hypothetical protein
VWWLILVIPAVRRLKQKDLEASLETLSQGKKNYLKKVGEGMAQAVE